MQVSLCSDSASAYASKLISHTDLISDTILGPWIPYNTNVGLHIHNIHTCMHRYVHTYVHTQTMHTHHHTLVLSIQTLFSHASEQFITLQYNVYTVPLPQFKQKVT